MSWKIVLDRHNLGHPNVYGESLNELQLDRPRNGLFLSSVNITMKKTVLSKELYFSKTGKKFTMEFFVPNPRAFIVFLFLSLRQEVM